ncbi:hypothetical protein [Coleofasciculus sp.]|uniref:hypothetical protein n=1 Tax=Coleofasciculus sp. TaxID=3100458 RepID=UPI0039F9D717
MPTYPVKVFFFLGENSPSLTFCIQTLYRFTVSPQMRCDRTPQQATLSAEYLQRYD